MSPFKIVFIHGYTASHLADWYPTLSKELDKLQIDYVIPDLPGAEYPHAQEWLNTLHTVISQITKPLVLVGHSLGTRTALLYLERYQPKVELVMLISAFANNTDNAQRHEGHAYPDFFDHQVNLGIIKPLVKKFVVMHSTDDTSEEPTSGIDYTQGVEIAGQLGADLISPNGRGHFDAPENAPFILEQLKHYLHF